MDNRYQLYLDDIIKYGNNAQFIHNGWNCVLQRNTHSGIWTGYVKVPKGNAINIFDIDIGINVYIIADPDEWDHIKICFDCGHIQDFIPGDFKIMKGLIPIPRLKVYRDYTYAHNKLILLYQQIILLSANQKL